RASWVHRASWVPRAWYFVDTSGSGTSSLVGTKPKHQKPGTTSTRYPPGTRHQEPGTTHHTPIRDEAPGTRHPDASLRTTVHRPRFIARSILSSSAMVGTQLAALDSGSRPSRIALTNSTSWRSNAATLSSGTSFPSLSVMESR